MKLEFDRGTLLITEIDEQTPVLPEFVWDERVNYHRAPACIYKNTREFCQNANIPWTDGVMDFPVMQGQFRTIALRTYQQAALTAWHAHHHQGIVVLPTGSGKTHLAMAAISEIRVPTLCLVPTRVLLEQWRDQLRKFYEGPIGCLGDGEHHIEAITVATFASARRHMSWLGNRFACVVVDEVHHLGQMLPLECLEMAIAPMRLGLTATLGDTNTLNSSFKTLLGPVIYELSINDLAGQFLAPYERIVLILDLTLTEQEIYTNLAAPFRTWLRQFYVQHPYANWATCIAELQKTTTGRHIFAQWQQSRRLLNFTKAKQKAVGDLLHKHALDKILIFTAENTSAYAIAKHFLVMPLTCEIKRQERARVLELFRTGELRALVSARVLNEGIDIPDADVAIVVGSSQGDREYVQRIGRLLRPHPHKRACVYELVTRATSEVTQAKRRRYSLGHK